MHTYFLNNYIDDATRFLKALSNSKRLEILCHLANGEKSVGDLCDNVNLSQSALSQHLAKLRQDGIVKTRRSAQTIYYSVAHPGVPVLINSIEQCFKDNEILADKKSQAAE